MIFTNSGKILTTPFESVKMNRVVTMNCEKEFCPENPLLKKKEEL